MTTKPSGGGGGGSKFRIASLQPDLDSRDLFAELMKDAERGELVGAVVVAIRRRKDHDQHYYLALSGRASSNPTYAAGCVAACQTLLHELALKQAGLK